MVWDIAAGVIIGGGVLGIIKFGFDGPGLTAAEVARDPYRAEQYGKMAFGIAGFGVLLAVAVIWKAFS